MTYQMFESHALGAQAAEMSDWERIWAPFRELITEPFSLRSVILVALTLSGLFASSLRDRGHSPRTKRRFLAVEPSLRVPQRDVTEFMAAYGRVPIDHVHEGSLWSRLMSRADGLLLRPSSSKPAFAILHHKVIRHRTASHAGVTTRVDGFRVRVWLEPGESLKHLEKSMSAPGYRQTRLLAFCDSDQLGDPKARVRCMAVHTTVNQRDIGHNARGEYVDFYSADPLLREFGNRKNFKRRSVPPDAIWMVRCKDPSAANRAACIERDPSPPAGGRYYRLLIWPRWIVVPALIVSGYIIGVRWLMEPAGVAADPLVAAAGIAQNVLIGLAIGIIALDISFLIMQTSARYGTESSWGDKWTAGTTGCVEDARRLRNGIRP